MRKGQEEKEKPFLDYKDPLGWRYRLYNEDEMKIVNSALVPTNRHLNLTDDFYENMLIITKHLGLHPHPLFKGPPDIQKKPRLDEHALGPGLGAPEDLPPEEPAEGQPQT